MSNAFKSFGEGRSTSIHFSLTMIGGLIYTLATLPIITDPTYLKGNRLIKLLPLISALGLLLTVKVWGHPAPLSSANFCILVAEILPGLGKRVILLVGLVSGSANWIGRAVCPFALDESEPVKNKNKTD